VNLPKISEYPRELFINGNIWTVRFCRKMPDSEKTDTTLGLCDPGSLEIIIKLGQGRLETLSTFIHEICHMIEFEHEIDIPHKLISKLEDPIRDFVLENFF
jgi:hypothetical protein